MNKFFIKSGGVTLTAYRADEVDAHDAQTEKELKNLRAAVANAIAYRDTIAARDARVKGILEAIMAASYSESIADLANRGIQLLSVKEGEL